MAAFRFSAWRPFASLSRLCLLTSSRSIPSRSIFSTHLTSRPLQRIPVRLYFMKPKKKKGLGLKGMAFGSLALSTMAGFSIIILGRPRTDEDLQAYASESFLKAYLKRSWAVLLSYYNDFAMPSSSLLLPDPLPPPYQPPYTLVLELNDLLIHSTYELTAGWRHKRRPGVTMFLKQLAPFFEIIIFTNEVAFSAQPIVVALDPKNEAIFYSLFRDSTTYVKGTHVKDLTNLNRDLSRVIAVDVEAATCERNENNCLILKKWEGDGEDRQLKDLAAFLQSIAVSGVGDVRPILEHYRKEENPLEYFRERQAILAKTVEEEQKKQQEKKQVSGTNWLFKGFQSRKKT